MVTRQTLKRDLENATIGKIELTTQALSILTLQLLHIIDELEHKINEIENRLGGKNGIRQEIL